MFLFNANNTEYECKWFSCRQSVSLHHLAWLCVFQTFRGLVKSDRLNKARVMHSVTYCFRQQYVFFSSSDIYNEFIAALTPVWIKGKPAVRPG